MLSLNSCSREHYLEKEGHAIPSVTVLLSSIQTLVCAYTVLPLECSYVPSLV